MGTKRARVGLARSGDRRANVLRALELVRDDVISKIRGQVMIKPNLLSCTSQLASSHVDALRGVVDFLAAAPMPPDEIVVAEGANEDRSGLAYENFDYHALVEESSIPIRLVDLHQETEWVETPIVLADRNEVNVRMPKIVLDSPCTISLAIPKTHDVCVVTLALKNMIMGTLYKPDRIKMHGFKSHAERTLPEEAQLLNVNLIRVARFLSPDIAVVDGWQGMEGNGPMGGDGVELGIAAASADVFAADAVVAKTMGFDPMALGLLNYGHELGLGVADLDEIDVLETRISAVERGFKPHETTDLQMQWQRQELLSYLPAWPREQSNAG